MTFYKKLALAVAGLALLTTPLVAQAESSSSSSASSASSHDASTSYDTLEATSNELTSQVKDAFNLKDAKASADKLAKLFHWTLQETRDGALNDTGITYTNYDFGQDASLLSSPDNQVLALAMGHLSADQIRERLAGFGVKPDSQMDALLGRTPSKIDKVFVYTKDFGVILSGRDREETTGDQPEYDLYLIFDEPVYRELVKAFE